MNQIYFATTNTDKFQIARNICNEAGLEVKQVALDIDEIQGEDPYLIVRDKAKRAFEQLGGPVVVTDDSWNIRALNGFPGAYMKSINYWFESEDFLRLMNGVEDRKITLHQFLAYTDGNITEIFKKDIEGEIIHEIRGKHTKAPHMNITTLNSDNSLTLAEVFNLPSEDLLEYSKNRPEAWHDFTKWYKANQK